jgi:hypothetical protein
MSKIDGQFLVRFDKNILEKRQTAAEQEGRTVTELIREAVAGLLRNRERKTPKKL